MTVMDNEAIPVLENLKENSSILTADDHIAKLNECLPATTVGTKCTLLYGTETHGTSLNTLYLRAKTDRPTLIVIKDKQNNVFGSFLSCGPKKNGKEFYGTGVSFVFTFYPEFRQFTWKGTNNFIAQGNKDSLAIGSSGGHSALWLDNSLKHGRTQKCATFENEPLAAKEDFEVCAVEIWGFVKTTLQ